MDDLIDALRAQTEAIQQLVEMNRLLIQAMAQSDDGVPEQAMGYLDAR